MRAYSIASFTDRGKLRPANEDSLLCRTGQLGGTAAALLAVADGMGGLACGAQASGAVIAALSGWWDAAQNAAAAAPPAQQLAEVVYAAHRAVYLDAQQAQRQSGTTLSALLLLGRDYHLLQIGDSRIYLREDGRVRLLTTDQNLYHQKLAAGQTIPGGLDGHALRALVNALGASAELTIAKETGRVGAGAAFLLCTDGFYGELPGGVESRRWGEGPAPQRELQAMAEEVLAGRAPDNLTAVLCRLPRIGWGGFGKA